MKSYVHIIAALALFSACAQRDSFPSDIPPEAGHPQHMAMAPAPPTPAPPPSSPLDIPNVLVRRDSNGSFDAGTARAIHFVGGDMTLVNALGFASGGTSAQDRQSAIDALVGAVTNGYVLQGNGTHVVMGSPPTPTLSGDVTGPTSATVLANIPAAVTATSATGTTITSSVANSGTNSAFTDNTTNVMTVSTRLRVWQNHGVDECSIYNDGSLEAGLGVVAGVSALRIPLGSYIGLDRGTLHSQLGTDATTHGVYMFSNATNSGTNAAYLHIAYNVLSGSTKFDCWQTTSGQNVACVDNQGKGDFDGGVGIGPLGLFFSDGTNQTTAAITSKSFLDGGGAAGQVGVFGGPATVAGSANLTYGASGLYADGGVTVGTLGLTFSDGTNQTSASAGITHNWLDGGGVAGQLCEWTGPATAGGDPNVTWSNGVFTIDGGLIVDAGATINGLTLTNALNAGGAGVSGQCLKSGGAGTAPSWASCATGGSGSTITWGTAAQRPDAGTSGNLDYCFLCQTWFIDDGTQWRPMAWGRIAGYAPPAASSLTAQNGGSTTLTDIPLAGFGLHLVFPNGGAAGTAQFRGYSHTVQYADAGPSFDIHAEGSFTMNQPMNNGFPGCGVYLSDGTKFVTCGMNSAGANQGLLGQSDWYPQNLSWTNATTVAAHSEGDLPMASNTFWRIKGTGTANSFECDVSYDRNRWYSVGTQSPTFTPTKAGIGCYMQTSTDNAIDATWPDYSDGTWPDGG